MIVFVLREFFSVDTQVAECDCYAMYCNKRIRKPNVKNYIRNQTNEKRKSVTIIVSA
jgi:hypothetical protein